MMLGSMLLKYFNILAFSACVSDFNFHKQDLPQSKHSFYHVGFGVQNLHEKKTDYEKHNHYQALTAFIALECSTCCI